MKVTGSTIQQLDKTRPDGRPLPRSECRRWRLWATTDGGRKSRRFTGTYTQACDALSAFVDELQERMPNSDTFGAYAASWHSWRAESGDFSPNTIANESTAVKALRRTDLDGMRMDEVTPEDCRNALLWLKRHPTRGDEYRPSTMALFRRVLGAVMAQAVDDGKLSANPVDKVPAPKVRKSDREALSPDEIGLLLNRLDEQQVDGRLMAVYLMLCLGLRRGEACAVEDANVTGGYAKVCATVRNADNTVGPTKSDAGARVVPVPPRLQEKVDEWRALRDRLGLHDARYLCCTKNGGRLSTSSVNSFWAGGEGYTGLRDKIGCHGMKLHELRHSNLSMMARHMSPFDLQRYAGWSSIAPARIYVHDDLDAVSRAVERAWK